METNTQINSSINQKIDTNVEYISAKGIQDQPPIITSVFRSIFVETPKDLFNSIKNFFLRYITLFKEGFKYLKYPSLKLDPFATKDYKESCQHTFELVMIVTATLIFLVKMGWIPAEQSLANMYNNDLGQMFIEFFVFLCFAVAYFILIVLAVFAGRVFRILFKIPITRQECDILFTYLNNTLFGITAIVAMLVRCFVQYESVKESTIFPLAIFGFYIIVFAILVYKWSVRFSLLNQVPEGKKKLFQITITILTAIFLGFCSTQITSFISGM